ncbi:MAG TPA: 50S ribosomal protein L30 [Myxococcota bacterium]|nr:50S ribosomal protein L30 [Myxococcota bacterium]
MTAQGAKGRVRVKLVRSAIGYDRGQRATLKGLGLRRLHQTVELPDTPSVQGMISKVRHLVRVEG